MDLKNVIFIFENENSINLPNKVILNLDERKNENRYLKKYKTYKIFKKFLKNVNEIWIQDHLLYADYFVSKFKNIKLLEDGLMNYELKYSKKLKRHIKIKNWILGGPLLVDENKFGVSKNISEIYLTGLKEILLF